MDASWNCVSGSGVGAAAADVVSETGGSAAAAAVSDGSGSGVTVLPTDDMAEGATGSDRLRGTPASAPIEAIAVASFSAPALEATASLVDRSSAVGVGETNAVPHKTANAATCRDLITELPPRAWSRGRGPNRHTIGSIVGSRPVRAAAEITFF
jgi:hypothetical protein